MALHNHSSTASWMEWQVNSFSHAWPSGLTVILFFCRQALHESQLCWKHRQLESHNFAVSNCYEHAAISNVLDPLSSLTWRGSDFASPGYTYCQLPDSKYDWQPMMTKTVSNVQVRRVLQCQDTLRNSTTLAFDGDCGHDEIFLSYWIILALLGARVMSRKSKPDPISWGDDTTWICSW